MVITIHQPEHFPYMGFFQKVSKSEMLVLLDNVKYRKNYFQNRNKFLNKNNIEEYFTIPVSKESVKLNINEVVPLETSKGWKNKILNKIYYNFGIDVAQIYEPETLAEINTLSIKWALARLDINVPIVKASDLGAVGTKSELLANICKELDADTYISGPSGKDYLDLSHFGDIKVEFFTPKVTDFYSCIQHLV